jgi:hypothetical protein
MILERNTRGGAPTLVNAGLTMGQVVIRAAFNRMDRSLVHSRPLLVRPVVVVCRPSGQRGVFE